AIHQYLELNNSHPKPFAWVKSADDILASIERFCLRISNSGH
ncbi:MAG: IS630 family transposase, partial [Giesbergeria sp.]